MNNAAQHDLLNAAWQHYGSEAQLRKAAEEMIELAHAILRLIQESKATVPSLIEMRRRLNAVIDESADVEIMIAQMVSAGLLDPHEITERKWFKLDRLGERINAERTYNAKQENKRAPITIDALIEILKS
jgi:hypothetical protein